MYFPAFYETNIACCECEKKDCHSRGKFQRDKRDFTVTSGRCPRLPDMRGFVDNNERINQRNAYPLVYAEGSGDHVSLHLSTPGDKRLRKVYQTRSGYWYYKTKDECGNKIRRVIHIGIYRTFEAILAYMERVHSDYCIFPCETSDLTV